MGDSNWPPSTERLEELIDEAITDAYGVEEQRIGFFTLLQDNLALPFETEVLGVRVTVERIDLTAAEEIVAFCRRAKHRQAIRFFTCLCPRHRRRAPNGSRRTDTGLPACSPS
jgi:hypothetical protein